MRTGKGDIVSSRSSTVKSGLLMVEIDEVRGVVGGIGLEENVPILHVQCRGHDRIMPAITAVAPCVLTASCMLMLCHHVYMLCPSLGVTLIVHA